jgi:hypothetical protein
MASSIYMQNAIQYFAHRGFRVQSQSDTQVQLVKYQNRSGCFAALLFLLGIIPGIIYLLLVTNRFVLLTDVGNGIQVSYNNRQPRFVSYADLDAGNYTKLHKFVSPVVILILVIIATLALIIALAVSSSSATAQASALNWAAMALLFN